MKCALYRHFDPHGVLLYVGIATDPHARAGQHVAGSEWVHYARRGSVEWFDDRGAAELAELATIRAEGPVFNRVGAVGDPDARIYAYKVGQTATLRAFAAHQHQQVCDELAARRAPDSSLDLVTLREAWTSGLVAGGWEALRKAARRPGFPAPAGQAARNARLYDRASLVAWSERRRSA